MYQLMAKCEELSKSMKPVYKLHDQMYPFMHLLVKDVSNLARTTFILLSSEEESVL